MYSYGIRQWGVGLNYTPHFRTRIFYAHCTPTELANPTYKPSLSLPEIMDDFCWAGSVQQAQQSTHLADGLNPL